MEVETRKKRVTTGREEERERSQKPKLDPTEEEVDEFFAILRRMKLAVNHFHRKGNHWREALERAEVAFHDGDDQRRHPAVKNNARRFDLNTLAPEASDA